MTNLTSAEIAAITEKANLLFPESPQGYIAAACEYAAEIKRLREGIDQGCKYWSISSDVRNHFKELLNNQP